MAEILPFEHEFDGTDMSPEQIREHARELGWPGIHLDSEHFMETGRLIVRRLSRRHVEKR